MPPWPKAKSTLTLNLTGYTRELHELVSSNDYIGSNTFYYYNLPVDTDNDYYNVKLSTDPLVEIKTKEEFYKNFGYYSPIVEIDKLP